MKFIKHPFFVFAWPFLAATGVLLFPMLFRTIYPGDMTFEPGKYISSLLHLYMYIFLMIWGIPFSFFAFPTLIWSFVRWFKNPCLKTLLWTMFTSWVLYSYPVVRFICINSMYGFGR